jgi:hypothetical protein
MYRSEERGGILENAKILQRIVLLVQLQFPCIATLCLRSRNAIIMMTCQIGVCSLHLG